MASFRRAAFVLAAAALIPACGGGGGGGGGGSTGPVIGPIDASGGDATSNGADFSQGGGGTTASAVYSRGMITVGIDPAPAPPTLPTPPATGTVVTSGMLTGSSYTQASDHILITGTVVTPDTGTYTITATTGDIVISGSLQAGDGAGNPTTLVLSAGGTIYISGSVLTTNTDGIANGNSGAPLQATGYSIVVTGTISTSGEDGTPPGAGGNVTLTSPSYSVSAVDATFAMSGGDAVGSANGGTGGLLTIDAGTVADLHGGSVTAVGGDGTGSGSIFGGLGGAVTILAPTAVEVHSTLDLRGGAASSTQGAAGGQGGTLTINDSNGNSGPAAVHGIVKLGGGAASGGGGAPNAVTGGIGGDLIIGAPSPTGAPSSVSLGAGITARGGAAGGSGVSGTFGGLGGTFRFVNDYATAGGIQIDGLLDLSGGPGLFGGDAENGPTPFDALTLKVTTGDIEIVGSIVLQGGNGWESGGAGGTLVGTIGGGSVVTAGNFILYGGIFATGGSSSSGSFASGAGFGGDVTLSLLDTTAGASANCLAYFLAGSLMDLSAGFAAGYGLGANGGVLQVTANGDVVLAGTIRALGGGSGLDLGGEGGFVDILTDPGATGAADITLTSSGFIDVSSGFGYPAGNARNDGFFGTVTNDSSSLAVRFDAGAAGVVQNSGFIRAAGAAYDGNGGDILFRGAGLPNPGSQNRSGSGFGYAGDYGQL